MATGRVWRGWLLGGVLAAILAGGAGSAFAAPFFHSPGGLLKTMVQEMRLSGPAAIIVPPGDLAAVKGSIRVARSNLGWLNEKIAAESALIAADQQRLALLNAEAARAKERLAAAQAKAKALALRLEQTRRRLRQRIAVFDQELRFIEEHGQVSYWSVFVQVHSFSDFVGRIALLLEVGQALAARALLVKRLEQAEALRAAQLAREVRTIRRTATRIQRQASVLRVRTLAAGGAKAKLDALRRQTIDTLKRSVSASLNWKTLAKTNPTFFQSLHGRLTRLNQTLSDLLSLDLNGSMSRAHLYQALYPLVRPIAHTFSLPTALVMAVITEESGGDQTAVSRTGAIGLMQLEPGTARFLGINPYDARTNVVGGSLYLHQLLTLFHGNLSLALSSYNGGPRYVLRHHAVMPATQGYVAAVESLYQAYRTMVYSPPPPVAPKTAVVKKAPLPPSAPALPLTISFGRVRAVPE